MYWELGFLRVFLCTIVSPYFIVKSLQLRGRRQIAEPCKYCLVRVIVFFDVCFLYLFCFSQVGILVKFPTQTSREQSSQILSSSAVSLVKPIKLDFPRFSGEDPASWMYKAKQYFGYYQTPTAKRLMVASFHMEQEALVWFQDTEEASVFSDWEGMV